MRKLFLLCACLALTAALAGCETVKGVGRDITGAGEFVQGGMSSKKGR